MSCFTPYRHLLAWAQIFLPGCKAAQVVRSLCSRHWLIVVEAHTYIHHRDILQLTYLSSQLVYKPPHRIKSSTLLHVPSGSHSIRQLGVLLRSSGCKGNAPSVTGVRRVWDRSWVL